MEVRVSARVGGKPAPAEVQEILSRRHGMAQEVIDRIPKFRRPLATLQNNPAPLII